MFRIWSWSVVVVQKTLAIGNYFLPFIYQVVSRQFRKVKKHVIVSLLPASFIIMTKESTSFKKIKFQALQKLDDTKYPQRKYP